MKTTNQNKRPTVFERAAAGIKALAAREKAVAEKEGAIESGGKMRVSASAAPEIFSEIESAGGILTAQTAKALCDRLNSPKAAALVACASREVAASASARNTATINELRDRVNRLKVGVVAGPVAGPDVAERFFGVQQVSPRVSATTKTIFQWAAELATKNPAEATLFYRANSAAIDAAYRAETRPALPGAASPSCGSMSDRPPPAKKSKTPAEWDAELAAITDPFARTTFLRTNDREIKIALCRAQAGPNAHILGDDAGNAASWGEVSRRG